MKCACGHDDASCPEARYQRTGEHTISSWVEGRRGGGFVCSCGQTFQTRGYDSEDRSMEVLFRQHLASTVGDTPPSPATECNGTMDRGEGMP